jgi:hypothetical protein
MAPREQRNRHQANDAGLAYDSLGKLGFEFDRALAPSGQVDGLGLTVFEFIQRHYTLVARGAEPPPFSFFVKRGCGQNRTPRTLGEEAAQPLQAWHRSRGERQSQRYWIFLTS